MLARVLGSTFSPFTTNRSDNENASADNSLTRYPSAPALNKRAISGKQSSLARITKRISW
jgi:hypothetical protein